MNAAGELAGHVLTLAAVAGPGTPERMFNPLVDPVPLSVPEVLAGPFGLLAFLPLVPLVLLAARYRPRMALIGGGLVWLLATLRPLAAAVVLGGLLAASLWVYVLTAARRRGRLGPRAMIALVWLGLHALALPLWWQGYQSWYPSRMAAFHSVGLAYFLLRFVAWGVTLARDPHQPIRPWETLCWLLYPPCMRLGPLLLREEFGRRLAAWKPWRSSAWRAGLPRLGLFVLGGFCLACVQKQLPHVARGAGDFFAAPEAFTTSELLRVVYLTPIQIYLILWTYNELAAALGLWVGIRVDNNFNWLPRATSVRDFWRRWHITLGTWLREYVYIPLGGNRRHVVLNQVVVFGYCGLWHGASWSFLAWGVSQAAALSVQRLWDGLWKRSGGRPRPRGLLWTLLCWLLTMHYQVLTILVFVDFEHCAVRIVSELARRLDRVAY